MGQEPAEADHPACGGLHLRRRDDRGAARRGRGAATQRRGARGAHRPAVPGRRRAFVRRGKAAAKRTPSGIFARPEFARADSGLAPRKQAGRARRATARSGPRPSPGTDEGRRRTPRFLLGAGTGGTRELARDRRYVRPFLGRDRCAAVGARHMAGSEEAGHGDFGEAILRRRARPCRHVAGRLGRSWQERE